MKHIRQRIYKRFSLGRLFPFLLINIEKSKGNMRCLFIYISKFYQHQLQPLVLTVFACIQKSIDISFLMAQELL